MIGGFGLCGLAFGAIDRGLWLLGFDLERPPSILVHVGGVAVGLFGFFAAAEGMVIHLIAACGSTGTKQHICLGADIIARSKPLGINGGQRAWQA